MGSTKERRSKGIPLTTPVDGGTPDVPTAEDFYARLNPQDKTTVTEIVDIVKGLVNIYDGTHPAFFAVYGIGGNVTKQGERPDVDLLIATSANWDGSYEPLIEQRMNRFRNEGNWDEYYKLRDEENRNEDIEFAQFHSEEGRANSRKKHHLKNDWICGSIKDQLEGRYTAEVLDDLPTNYNMGSGAKGLLRLIPVNNITSENPGQNPDQRRQIDIVYVREVRYIAPEESSTNSYENRTLEYFETTTDVDSSGQPLPKIPLYRTDNRGREMLWHR